MRSKRRLELALLVPAALLATAAPAQTGGGGVAGQESTGKAREEKARGGAHASAPGGQAPKGQTPKGQALSALAKKGEYLTLTSGCHDCHTPLMQTPGGPAPDMARMFSGHPEGMALPPPPALPAGPWQVVATPTLTAWAGPWGVSYAANITPDAETGLGAWTEAQFIEALRNGRHQGRGRPILPPMPWMYVGQRTDAELRAMWAYLQSVPPVRNRVPEPQPPQGVGGSPPGPGQPQR
jgi:hypothetical protein